MPSTPRTTSEFCEATTVSGWNPARRSFVGGVRCSASAKIVINGKRLCMTHAKAIGSAARKRTALRLLVESKWPRYSFEGGWVYKDPDLMESMVDLLLPHFIAGRSHK